MQHNNLTEGLVGFCLVLWLLGLACAVAFGRGQAYISGSVGRLTSRSRRLAWWLTRIAWKLIVGCIRIAWVAINVAANWLAEKIAERLERR